ncbi:hypothetical protein BCV72DRAFT_106694 [Rhizopus microsporus var. microsporus]|uniref:Nucleoporin Nup54 alpha-helical domain-containing protein n=2 Tax=Rhizopus microsporus TaxID=58291 RepID=A0A2G4SUC6_RHIZD|nr:uncharacterized protein RHIMIDRAFT_252103 [Rhizopus microsporus ATCC 52813]ORE11480.1 hypothetical protein BCV72DRAFT_106694 [Rhizopus microsporus var. microsporus]PHZ12361.1 hypothetical protein RHIMIDRAFT_252103 [Rhizopus microsporus ATCC 52813]
MSFTFGAPSTSGFGGFGTTTANTTPTSGAAPATSSSGFTFNNTGGFGTNTSTSGFTLGTSAPTSTAPTTGFSFTNSNNTQQSTNTFGAPASTAGFSFGTPASTTGFGFGQQQQQQQQQNKPSLFGGSGFGSTGLGSSIQTLGGDNKFGSTFGINSAEQQKKQRDQQIYKLLCDLNQEADTATTGRKGYEAKNVWQALALLKSYYDPKSPYCRFRHYFYNVVNPQEVHLYQKPADHDPEEWTAAQKANPDPKTLVPALAIGFDDVQKRLDMQSKLSEAHSEKLKELEQVLTKIQTSCLTATISKLDECKQRHMELAQRLVKFLKYAQVLRNKGLSITPDEEAMRTRLENIQEQLQKSELFRGKLNQLWAQLQLIKESGRKYGKIDGVEEWHAVSEQHMDEITKNLNEQNKGIQHVIDILHTDTTDIEMLRK